jgi:hypothetical protein
MERFIRDYLTSAFTALFCAVAALLIVTTARATPSVANVQVSLVNQGFAVSYLLGSAATSGTCSIYKTTDPSTPVAVLPLTGLAKGPNTVIWNGVTTAGVIAPAGQYFAVVAATADPVSGVTMLTGETSQSGAPLNSFTKTAGRNYWQISSNIYPKAPGREAFHNLTYYPTIDDDGTTKFAGINIFGPDGPNMKRVASPAGVYSSSNKWPVSTWGSAFVMPDGKVLLGPKAGSDSAAPEAGTLCLYDPADDSITAFPRNGSNLLKIRQFAAFGPSSAPIVYAADDGSYGGDAAKAGVIFADFSSGSAPASVTTLVKGGSVVGNQLRNSVARGLVMNRAQDTMWVSIWGNNNTVSAEVIKFIKTGAGVPGVWEEADGVKTKYNSSTPEPAFVYPSYLKAIGYQPFICLSPDEQTLWIANNDILSSTTRFNPNRSSIEGLDPVTGASRGPAFTLTGISFGPQKISQEGSYDPATGTYKNGNLHVASYGFTTGITALRHSVFATPDGATTDETQGRPFTVGVPPRLSVITQPAGARADTPFRVQPAVAVLGWNDEVLTDFTGDISIELVPGTGTAGAVLSGTKTATVVNGIATFQDLWIDAIGSGYVLRATNPLRQSADTDPFDVTPGVLAAASGSWGDVDEDGYITGADARLAQRYIDNRGSLTLAQAERIIRYGDIAGTVNRTTIGNNVVDDQDVMREGLLCAGLIDAGTTGVVKADYGDVDGDGKVTIVDMVAVNRSRSGITAPAEIQTRVMARGGGDVSPTVPFISFGDGQITSADVAAILARAMGTETNAPVYQDFWPLHSPTADYPTTPADLYAFTDVNGYTGDLLHRISFATQSPKQVRGYTVTEVVGTDGSIVGAFKGIDGSIYALYFKYPRTFGDNLIEFASPVKVLDIRAVNGEIAEWSGRASGTLLSFGVRPIVFRGRVLSQAPVYVPSAGSYPAGTPPSRWSSTIRVRLDIGVLAGPTSQQEMQQAFFFDFTPNIGIVGRGQASLMGSPAPTNDRVRLEQDSARVRGLNYSLSEPTP